MAESKRSLNIMDFSNNHRDFYLLDEYSDSNQYGGESKVELNYIT